MATPAPAPASAHIGRPDKPTVIYDGQCGFCLKQVGRIRRRDTAGVFDYRPRQEPGLDERFPQITHGDFNTGLRLIEPDGQVQVGADGVYHMARRLPRLWLLAWLYRVPGLKQIFAAMYAWVARNRYKLAGRCEEGDACRL